MVEINIISTLREGFTIGFEYFGRNPEFDYETINLRFGFICIAIDIKLT
jgi:hypothetical protein